jgi:DNA-binding NarL/FixJ family response regulator
MPRSSAATARPPAERAGVESRSIALVASPEARERIAKALVDRGHELALFNDADDLLARRLSGEGEVTVIHVEDTASSLPYLLERMQQHLEEAPTVFVCATIQSREIRAALASGVAGIVLEDQLEEALGPCLLAVHTGQICVPRDHWRQIEPPVLSAREKQILGLVVMGYMNSQIAERLFLAESTVKSHLSSAFGKLGVRSRNEAVNLILDSRRGLGMGILALGGERLESTPTTP